MHFLDVSRCSNLIVNISECILIALWDFIPGHVRLKTKRLVPEWNDFQIKSYGKGLGFIIGPCSEDARWSTVVNSYSDVCKYIVGLGLPVFQRILLYNMLAVSKFAYQAQLREIPKYVLKTERDVVSRMVSGIGNAFPTACIFNFKKANIFPVAPLSIMASAHASKCKIVVADGHWITCSRDYYHKATAHDARISCAFPAWLRSCSFNTLHRVSADILSDPAAGKLELRVSYNDGKTMLPKDMPAKLYDYSLTRT